MKKTLVTLGILFFGSSSIAVGQAVTFDPRVLPDQAHDIAGERVEVIQRGNEVRATLPWKGENGLVVKYDMGEPTPTERVKGRRDKEVVTEVINDSFKIDFLLNKKPKTNVFCQQFEGYEDYDFVKIQPLTEEEKQQGIVKNPDAIGSYDIRHKTLRNYETSGYNYGYGQFGQIDFPSVWEVGNKEATIQRAEDITFDSENGELCVYVQQDFLDKATYPVRVDPTIGYTAD